MAKKRDLGLGAAPRQLVATFEQFQVFPESELIQLLHSHRDQWQLARNAPSPQIVDWLVRSTKLREISIKSEIRTEPIVRYVWGNVPANRIALSLARNSYLSHATAASLHNLLTFQPDTIFVNREQSPKPSSKGSISQESVDRAFAGAQRRSRDAYHWSGHRILLLNGKHTHRLGVDAIPDATGELPVTDIERTLIDLTVRPDYAGGPQQVLEAYRRAKNEVSSGRLLEFLNRLDYRYPYHQAVGFYMKRADYDLQSLTALRDLNMQLNFYVAHGIEDMDFDPEWRVHFPRGLK